MRDLSQFEQFFYYKTINRYYSNVRILAEYEKPVNKTQLCVALRLLIEKYPILVMSVDGKSPKATIVNEILFDNVVEFVTVEEESIESILNLYHKKYFTYDENSVTWELKVINSKYILLLCDHLFFDGVSTKNFQVELSKLLDNEGEYDRMLFKRSSNSIVFPAPDEFINYKAPEGFVIPEIESPYKDLMENGNLTTIECQNGITKVSDCEIVTVDNDEMATLLKLCRDHNVKLTSLLVLLSNLSVKEFLPTKDIETAIPVDIRGKIQNENHPETTSFKFGLFVSSIGVKLPNINKLDSLINLKEINWPCVEYINTYIHTHAPISEYYISSLEGIDMKQYTDERFSKMENASIEISNLGQVKESKIKAMWFDQPSDTFNINIISTDKQTTLVLRCCRHDWVTPWKKSLQKTLNKIIIKQEN